MSDDNAIVSRKGETVGTWDGAKAEDLIAELARIKKDFADKGIQDKVEPSGVPHQDQFPEDLVGFTPYILWGCDKNAVCVVGSGANRTESVESIRSFYANDIAKDALARDKS